MLCSLEHNPGRRHSWLATLKVAEAERAGNESRDGLKTIGEEEVWAEERF